MTQAATNNTWRLLLSLIIVGFFISCENSNTVGGDLIEPASVKIDTVYINKFTQKSVEPFSGRIGQTPLGVYEDQLFGKYESTGYYRPLLLSKQDTLTLNSSFKLQLIFNDATEYGDSTKSVDMSVYRIAEQWRDKTIKNSDELLLDQSQLMGQFTYTNEDTIEVALSDSLFADYISIQESDDNLRDSLYNHGYFGFALVPSAANSKIVFPDLENSKIFYVDDSDEDTVSISFKNFAFNLKRTNTPSFANHLYLNSNLESFYSLNFSEIIGDIKAENLLKAEFVIYEDTLQLQNSLPANHVRPEFNYIDLKAISSSQFEYDMQFAATDFIAAKNSTNSLYSFNVTDQINQYIYGSLDSKELFLNLNPNSGIIYSSVFFDSSATNELRPKLILTTIE